MSPIASIAILSALLAAFAWSAARRWALLRVGRPEHRFDRLGERLRAVWRYAFVQEKMDYYQPAGIAHKLIFVGFVVLLVRTIILWGRGFSPTWNLFVLAPWMPLGKAYEFMKDSVAILVLFGVAVFVYYRVVRPMKRTTLSWEGLLILGIIATMMVADMIYDGASSVLAARHGEMCGEAGARAIASAAECARIATIVAPLGDDLHSIAWSAFPSPAGSAFAVLFKNLSPGALIVLSHAGFWTHATLVLIFLNLLPHSKHFHVITAIPNVFFKDLRPYGRLAPMADTKPSPPPAPDAPPPETPQPATYAERVMGLLEKASEAADPLALPIGVSRIEQFSWKAILDFYTCTECGRCSDNCPAHRTGKILSPKHLTLDLRNHLYAREQEMVTRKPAAQETPPATTAENPGTEKKAEAPPADAYKPIDIVSNVIHPDVLWACTTCRACEEQCPVMISYVDKIVDMRRSLVMIKNEFPHELQKPFQAMETNGNPWNLSRMDRAAWSDGLGIPTLSEKPDAAVLYWVGCAASYDDRAKKIARAVAKLLKQAGVDFAILGQEENCTGDPARRAGNELLFAMLAEGNVTTLKTYKEQNASAMRQVVTACPHCFNTLKNEYPDFGLELEVVHHTDYLLGLVAEKKLVPKNPVEGKVTYHDSCYLGRYNGVYDSPREILKSIPGVELVEPQYWNRTRGLCCGAGGAQMWMEEQNATRVNVKRTLQLVDTGASTIASACPFCMTMLTDGLKSQNLEETVKPMDVAELLEKSCAEIAVAVPAGAEAVPPELLADAAATPAAEASPPAE